MTPPVCLCVSSNKWPIEKDRQMIRCKLGCRLPHPEPKPYTCTWLTQSTHGTAYNKVDVSQSGKSVKPQSLWCRLLESEAWILSLQPLYGLIPGERLERLVVTASKCNRCNLSKCSNETKSRGITWVMYVLCLYWDLLCSYNNFSYLVLIRIMA